MGDNIEEFKWSLPGKLPVASNRIAGFFRKSIRPIASMPTGRTTMLTGVSCDPCEAELPLVLVVAGSRLWEQRFPSRGYPPPTQILDRSLVNRQGNKSTVFPCHAMSSLLITHWLIGSYLYLCVRAYSYRTRRIKNRYRPGPVFPKERN